MGSLMSGWSSSVLSDKEVRLMRNRSLTKDEVAAFWRRQQQQHGSPAPEPNAGSPRAETILAPLAAGKHRLEATRSLPPLPGRGGTRGSNDDDDLTCCLAYGYGAGDKQLVSSRSGPPSPAATARGEGSCFLPENAAADSSGMSRGWWTRSSWAFLNEPPPPPPLTREEVPLGGSGTKRSFACDQLHAARIVTGNA